MYRAIRFASALLTLLLTTGLATNVQAATHSRTVTVKMAEQGEGHYVFSPANITIHVGDTVVWKNTTDTVHTATADDMSWDSGDVEEGQTFSHTFSQAGTIHYHCHYHRAMGMVGTITVLTGPAMPSTGGGGMSGSVHAPDLLLGSFIAALLVLGALLVRAGRV